MKRRLLLSTIPVAVVVPLVSAWATARQDPGRADSRLAGSFGKFAPQVSWRSNGKVVSVESTGMPDHTMMVGIRAWQQQVPLPQAYKGSNAWTFPAVPVPAKEPMSAKDHFLRGAIAIAANGIPIFNALNNRGVDSNLAGELDTFGGHCGRADDYHYHVAPLHLGVVVGKQNPVGWALDGYPLYGETEPDGSPVKGLDSFNGHDSKTLGYHYHGTRTYPYLNGGFHGEVVEREGQVDPQPRAMSPRPATPPLPGARITAFEQVKPGEYRLDYDVDGRKGSVAYKIAADGSAVFDYTYSNGSKETRSYSTRGRGDGQGDRPRRRDDAPPADRPPTPPQSGDAPRRGGGGGRSKDPEIVAPRPEDFQFAGDEVRSGKPLPVEFTCDGAGVSPPVAWRNVPAGTKSLALVMHHVPPGDDKPHVYWVLTGIAPETKAIGKDDRTTGVRGANTVNRNPGYAPPCSQGPGRKWYTLTLYALSKAPAIDGRGATRDAVLAAIRESVIGTAVAHVSVERTGGNR